MQIAYVDYHGSCYSLLFLQHQKNGRINGKFIVSLIAAAYLMILPIKTFFNAAQMVLKKILHKSPSHRSYAPSAARKKEIPPLHALFTIKISDAVAVC